MAFELKLSLPDRNIYTALAADTKNVTDTVPTDLCFETDTKKTFEFNGSEWLLIRSPDYEGNDALSVLVQDTAIDIDTFAASTFSIPVEAIVAKSTNPTTSTWKEVYVVYAQGTAQDICHLNWGSGSSAGFPLQMGDSVVLRIPDGAPKLYTFGLLGNAGGTVFVCPL